MRAFLVLALLLSTAAHAGETISYSYDALGRLTQVSRSGMVNNGASATYTYDPANNRTNVTVTASGGGGGSPSFSVNDPLATEGGGLVFTVTKSGAASGTFTVDYATANGTGTAGSDYTAASGMLTFLTSDTTKTVTVMTIDDASVESAETVFLNLSNATGGATIADSQGVGTIADNDGGGGGDAVSFTVSDATATEGSSLLFTVTKSGAATATITISYATANGTAVAPGDYTAKSGTLTFLANETSKIVSVATATGGPNEGDETMFLNLSGASSGTIADAQGVGTIENGELCPLC